MRTKEDLKRDLECANVIIKTTNNYAMAFGFLERALEIYLEKEGEVSCDQQKVAEK